MANDNCYNLRGISRPFYTYLCSNIHFLDFQEIFKSLNISLIPWCTLRILRWQNLIFMPVHIFSKIENSQNGSRIESWMNKCQDQDLFRLHIQKVDNFNKNLWIIYGTFLIRKKNKNNVAYIFCTSKRPLFGCDMLICRIEPWINVCQCIKGFICSTMIFL